MYVDVGFGNFVEESKIISISRPDSAPMRRLIQTSKDKGNFLDLTQGKKTRSVIVSYGTDVVVMGSSIQTSTLIGRIKKENRDSVQKLSEEEAEE